MHRFPISFSFPFLCNSRKTVVFQSTLVGYNCAIKIKIAALSHAWQKYGKMGIVERGKMKEVAVATAVVVVTVRLSTAAFMPMSVEVVLQVLAQR